MRNVRRRDKKNTARARVRKTFLGSCVNIDEKEKEQTLTSRRSAYQGGDGRQFDTDFLLSFLPGRRCRGDRGESQSTKAHEGTKNSKGVGEEETRDVAPGSGPRDKTTISNPSSHYGAAGQGLGRNRKNEKKPRRDGGRTVSVTERGGVVPSIWRVCRPGSHRHW